MRQANGLVGYADVPTFMPDVKAITEKVVRVFLAKRGNFVSFV